MADPVPHALLVALQAQLADIRVANGYHTDLGAEVRIYDEQRAGSALPSIALGSRGGQLSLGGEVPNVSPKARRMELVLEAAMVADLADEQRVAHLMLEDIERALERDTRAAPYAVRAARFDTWSVVPPPPGVNAVVLQLVGSADYKRP